MQTGEAYRVEVSVKDQRLRVFDGNFEHREYIISTSKYGTGNEIDSYKTPVGHFEIKEKIGDGEKHGTIFKGRYPVGVFDFSESSDEDLILSRIFWLNGTEPENANTFDRYIYIHGTNHEDSLGQPNSCGCIRMHNEDIIELYELIPIGTSIFIYD
ncbi:MAG: L,D-transpeptidase [Verrucomicrobiota bacterium]|nr:L,D-transpeptidase [Verrucomicrobiota bacterium]